LYTYCTHTDNGYETHVGMSPTCIGLTSIVSVYNVCTMCVYKYHFSICYRVKLALFGEPNDITSLDFHV